MSYKHGIYGAVAASNNATEIAQGTVPAYIGSAPVHRINTDGSADFDYSGYVNKPILISSLREAREMGLYSDDWDTYTLSEVIHAHFSNGVQSVAPFVLLNILDPKTDVDADAATATVTMKKSGTKFVGSIEDPLCCLDGITFTAEGATIGKTNYHYDGDVVVIEAEATVTSGANVFTLSATYKQIAFSAEKFDATNVANALAMLDYCEQLTGVIPNVLAAPGISEVPELHSLMVQKAIDKISGKWNLVVLSDIPASVETYEDAIAWKDEHAYDSKFDKVFWPAVSYNDKVYHLSTIGAFMMQYTDIQNDNIPYVSTSNKTLFCDRAVVGENETLLISEEKANSCNQVGITTVNSVKRSLRLWGSHMSNYNHTKLSSINAEDRFDAPVRMMMYILNYLQQQYINEIDQPFTGKDIDSIENSVQTWLDSLVNDGALLAATVSFNNESNTEADIANGDLVFELMVTYSVMAKSITFKLQYTSAGLVNILNAGGNE